MESLNWTLDLGHSCHLISDICCLSKLYCHSKYRGSLAVDFPLLPFFIMDYKDKAMPSFGIMIYLFPPWISELGQVHLDICLLRAGQFSQSKYGSTVVRGLPFVYFFAFFLFCFGFLFICFLFFCLYVYGFGFFLWCSTDLNLLVASLPKYCLVILWA